MKKSRAIAGAIAAVMVSCVASTGAAARSASVLLIWRVPAPVAQSADVQALEAGLEAVNFLVPQMAALDAHPAAKVTLALDPVFVDSLRRAAAGQDALAELAAGTLGPRDPRAAQIRNVLSTTVVPASVLRDSKAAERFVFDASAARLAFMGNTTVRFSHSDDVDYAASAVLLSLRGSGYARDGDALLAKGRLDERDLIALETQFTRGCADAIARLKKATDRGAIELAALPAYEPIMPLVIDAAGRNERVPFTVALNAGTDAAEAVDEGMRSVHALDPAHGDPGIISPAGAYDDDTAALLQSHHARYGVFSERVVRNNVGASQASVADARSAAFRSYLLETSKTNTLPIFFCSDTSSNSIDSLPLTSPAAAMAQRLTSVVKAALDAPSTERSPLVALCLAANGSILHRADRAAALGSIAAALSGGTARSATPRDLLSAHPPQADTYGYEAQSDAGGFEFWMGSQNQVSLWSALADARKAAGGDAGLSNAGVRDALLRAESGRWFSVLMLPQPQYLTLETIGEFRGLVAQIYRAANKPVPSNIAPVKLNQAAPATIPLPGPTRTPTPPSRPPTPGMPPSTGAPAPSASPSPAPASAPTGSVSPTAQPTHGQN